MSNIIKDIWNIYNSYDDVENYQVTIQYATQQNNINPFAHSGNSQVLKIQVQ